MMSFLITATLILLFDKGKSEFVKCIAECIKLSICRGAKELLKYNGTHPELCNLIDSEPYVCCGVQVEKALFDIHYGGVRKAEKKCKEIRGVYVETDYDPDYVKIQHGYAGTFVTENRYPLMAALGYGKVDNPAYRCGGFLVDKNVVITAAHCTTISGEPPVVVRTGSYPLSSNKTKPIRVIKVIRHPNYQEDTYLNDIAILFLAEHSKERPGCLKTSAIDIKSNGRSSALGYGTLSFGGYFSDNLVETNYNLVENEICKKEFQNFPILSSQLCALGEVRVFENKTSVIQDTCQGDSGGPLVNYYDYSIVYGIVSYGRGCGSETAGVYTNVTAYLDWIESIVWPSETSDERFYVS